MADKSHSAEVWASIEAEPDFEVSSFGRVRRAVASRCTPAGHIMALSVHQKGYLTVRLRGRPFYVHRLVAGAFCGELSGKVVNHRNANKQDNRASNLEVVTIAENNRHARALGLGRGRSLTSAQIEIVRSRHSSGLSARELAATHGVGLSTMKRYLSG